MNQQLKIFGHVLRLLCICVLLISGCSKNNIQTLAPEQHISTNLPPIIKSFDFTKENITVCDTIIFICLAEDPEDQPLKYEWNSYILSDISDLINIQLNGSFLQSNSIASWIPGPMKGTYLIVLNVIDTAGYEVEQDVMINVRHGLCDNVKEIYSVSKIDNQEIKDYSKLFRIVPKFIILSNHANNNFEGKVCFDSLDCREIINQDLNEKGKKSFYVNFSDLSMSDGIVLFTDIEITLEKMIGNWTFVCSTCDWPLKSFEAVRL